MKRLPSCESWKHATATKMENRTLLAGLQICGWIGRRVFNRRQNIRWLTKNKSTLRNARMGNMPFAAAIQKERAQSKIAKKRPLKWRAECFQASIRTSSGFETSKRAGAINGGISDRK